MKSVLTGALGQAGGGQWLTITTPFNKPGLQGGDLLIEQIMGRMDQADESISPTTGILVFKPFGVKGLAVSIRLVRRIGRMISG